MGRYYIYRLIIDLIQKSGKNLLGLFSGYSFSFQIRNDEETHTDSNKLDLSFFGKKYISLVRVFLVFVVMVWGVNGNATTYYSVSGQAPNATACWKPNRDGTGSSPSVFTAGDIFVVQGSANAPGGVAHSLTTTGTWSISGTSSKLWIEGGAILSDGHLVSLAAATTFQIESGGKYIINHGSTSVLSTFGGTENFDANATIEIQNLNTLIGSSAFDLNAIMDVCTTNLPNIIWNQQAGTSAFNLQSSSTVSKTIAGSFTVTKTGATGSLNISNRSNGYKLIINGNFTQTGGTLNVQGASSATTATFLEILGNFSLSGGTFDLSTYLGMSYNSSINIAGDFSMTGGTIKNTATTQIAQVYFTKNGTQTFSQSAGTFTTTYIQFKVNSNSKLKLQSNFSLSNSLTVLSGGSLDIPNPYYTTGSGSTILNSGSKLYIGHANGIYSSTSTGAVQTTTRTFSNTYFEYNGTAAQVTGSALPTNSAITLVINNSEAITSSSTGVSLSASVSFPATGSPNLSLTTGILTTGSYSMGISSTSTITGGSSLSYVNGYLTIQRGSGSLGVATYPIGKAGRYLPVEFTAITHSSGSTIGLEAFNANCGGTISSNGFCYLSSTEYWKMTFVANAPSNISAIFTRNTALGDLNIITSTALSGTYNAAASYSSLGAAATYPTAYSIKNSTVFAGNTPSPQYITFAFGSSLPNPGTATATLSSVCSGSSTTVSVSGYSAGATIQWQQSADGSSGWASVTGGSGGTTATYTTPILTSTTYYRAAITGGPTGCSSTSYTASATVTVNSNPASVNAGADVSICSGSSTNLSGSAGTTTQSASPNSSIPDNNPTGTTSTISLSNTGVNASAISSVTLNINHIWDEDLDITLFAPNGSSIDLSSDNGGNGDDYINTVFSASGSSSITSGTAPFTGTYLPEQLFSNLTGSADGTWSLKVVDDADLISGTLVSWSISYANSGTITYSWSPATGLSATNISNPTANPTSSTTYTMTATLNGCSVTDNVVVSVNSSIGGTASATSSSVISGNSTTISLSGNTGSTIQWQQSSDNSTWSNVSGGSGATTATYTTPNLTSLTYYRAQVQYGSCTVANSSSASVSILTPSVAATGALTAYTACSGSNSTAQSFSVSGSNLSADIIITPPTGFEVSTSSGSGFASSLTLTQTSASVASTTVYVRTTTSASGTPSGNITCASSGATTQNVSASGTINALPTISGTTSVCVGATTLLTGSATAHGSTPWSSASAGVASVSGGTVTGVSAGTSVITYMNTNGCSNTVTISVSASPTSPNAGTDVSICSGSSASLSGSASTSSGSGYPASQSGSIGDNSGNPFNTYWGNTKTQNLYTAAELTAAGLTTGSTINQIALEVTSAGENRSSLSIGYKFVSSATTSFTSATFQTGITNVYSGSLNSSIGVKTYSFSTPTSAWNGTDNLVLEYCFSQNVTGATACTIKALAAVANTSVQKHADGGTSQCGETVGDDRSGRRPYISISYSTPITYSWSPSTGLSATNIANPTANPTATTTYTMTATANGCSVTDDVIVTVNSSVGGTATATAATISSGASTTITLSANTGSTIQWQQSSNNSTWSTVSGGSGGSTATYTTPALSSTTYYRAQVQNGSCTVAYSSSASVTVSAPTISTSGTLSAFTACSGSNSTAQSFSVSGSNLTANITVTPPTGFEVSTSSGSGYASSVTLTQSSGSVASTTVYVRTTTGATNGAGGNIACASTNATTQNVATGSANINALPTISGTATVCMGSTTVLTGSGTAAASNAWASSDATKATINTTTTSGTVTPVAAGSTNITYTDNNGCTSAATSVTINALPTLVTVSTAGTYCTSTTLTAANSASGTIYYQGTTSGGTSTATPSTSQSVSSTGTYYFRAQSTAGCWGTEGSAAVTINTAPSISAQPSTSTQTTCINGTAFTALSVTASGTGLTYQWYSNTSATNSGGSSIGSATSSSYTPVNSASGTKYYYCIVSGTSPCAAATSNASGLFTVNALPTITGTASVCMGSTTVLTGSGTAAASNAWASSDATKATINTTTTSGTVTPVAAGSTNITYTDNNGCTSAATSVTINALPTTVTVSTAGTYCTSTTLTAANSASGTIYYQGTTSGGTSTATPSTSQSVSSTGTYYFRAQSTAGCWGTEGSAAVTINTAPSISAQPSTSTQTTCINGTAFTALSVTASGTGLTYQWYSNTSATNSGGSSIGSATSASYTPVNSASGTKYYYCIVSGTSPCAAATSNASGLFTVNALPTITGTASVCMGSTTVLTGSGTAAASNAWASSDATKATINTTTTSGTVTPVAAGSTNITYTDNNGCTSAATSVTINALPTISSTTAGSRCGNGTVNLGAAASAGTINWYAAASGGASLGTGTSFTTSSISSTTTYYVDATANGCTTGARSSALATVNNPMTTTPVNGDVIWVGSSTAWGTLGNWLTYNGTSYSTPLAAPSTANRVVISVANSCASAQPTLAANSSVGDLIIESGATLNQGSYTLTIGGSFTNSGTFTAGTGTTTFTGTGSINGANTFYNLTLNTSGTVTLAAAQIVSNNLTITSGTLDVSASNYGLSVGGNITNNGTFTSRSGTVTLNGGSAQTINGSTDPNFYNLTLNNAAGGSIGVNATVKNTFTFSAGKFTIPGGYTLSLGTSSANGSISGNSATSYFVAYDGGTIGYLKRFVNTKTATAYLCPIGDASNYTPLTMTVNSSSTLAAGAYFTVYTKASKLTALGSSITKYVNRYWDVTPSGITTPNYDITYTYVTGDLVGGAPSALVPVKNSSGTMYSPTGSSFTTGTKEGTGTWDSGNKSLTWTGLSTFSLYSGAENGGVALPVTLYTFEAKPYNKDVMVTWKTASEYNNDYFTVERSEDGVNFKKLGDVKGAGNSTHTISYFLLDSEYSKGINYYRLKQTDFNGDFTYSKIVAIDMTVNTPKVIMTVNSIGQEVQQGYTGLVFDIYSDGTSVKRIR